MVPLFNLNIMSKYKYVRLGIYSIRNRITNQFYIGKDKYLPYRWYTHKALLKANKHYNKKLQNSWNKYGEDNFEFSIIKEFTFEVSLNLINNFEIFYIKKYNCITKGYNLSVGGEGNSGNKLTDSTKLKISIANKGRRNSEIQCNNIKEGVRFRRKRVWEYDKDLQFIRIWDSPKDICNELGLNYNSIKLAIRKSYLHNKKYIFSYKPINKSW